NPLERPRPTTIVYITPTVHLRLDTNYEYRLAIHAKLTREFTGCQHSPVLSIYSEHLLDSRKRI
ncbi:hypothetical protein E4T56_gene8978, partial [Termitomyces sp. T112]